MFLGAFSLAIKSLDKHFSFSYTKYIQPCQQSSFEYISLIFAGKAKATYYGNFIMAHLGD
jgi:hypothetical protein